MKTICVASRKGGSNKTTTAINLACALGVQGKAVLVLDMDEQGTASLWYSRKEEDTAPNVRVMKVKTKQMDAVLEKARKSNIDFVIIDTMPVHTTSGNAAMALSDLVITTMSPSGADFNAAGITIRAAQRLGKHTVVAIGRISSSRNDKQLRQGLDGMGLAYLNGGLRQRVAYSNALGNGLFAGDLDTKAYSEVTALRENVLRALEGKTTQAASA